MEARSCRAKCFQRSMRARQVFLGAHSHKGPDPRDRSHLEPENQIGQARIFGCGPNSVCNTGQISLEQVQPHAT
jgi:hypothetical protein